MNNLRNKVQLIGKLGRNPEFKKTVNGKSLAKISVATKEVYKNTNGEKIVETQWHNCIAWGNTAERIEAFLKKGNEVAIQGKLIHNSYKSQSGETKYITQVQINEFMLLTKANAHTPAGSEQRAVSN